MEKISSNDEVGGAGGAGSYNALKRLDQLWSSLCASPLGKIEMLFINIANFVVSSAIHCNTCACL